MRLIPALSLFMNHSYIDLQNKGSMMKRRFMVTSNTSGWVLWAMLERDGSPTGRQTHSSELMTSHSLLRNNILGMKYKTSTCLLFLFYLNELFLQFSSFEFVYTSQKLT